MPSIQGNHHTSEFLHYAHSLPSIWGDAEAEAGLFALARKCDISRVVHSDYESGWKRPVNTGRISLSDWELLVEILFVAVDNAPCPEFAVKLLNTAANAVTIANREHPDAGNPQWEQRWNALADKVFQ